MRRTWRGILTLISTAAFFFLIVLFLIRIAPRPPVAEMEKTRKALFEAQKNRADVYSKKLYSQARIAYDSAMANWQSENKKFLYMRNYEKVARFALLATKKANEASENSVSSTTNFRVTLKEKIATLTALSNKINDLFETYPLTSEVRSRISRGKLLLSEASISYDSGQYLQANRKLTDSEYLLTESYEYANSNLKNYFKSYSVWRSWVDKTIRESQKNNDYSIIIDKFSRKCMVYLAGTKKYEFEAELGKNWVGDKHERGDQATPEGMYRIIKKFDGPRTKYYKALLIDYPNDDDRQRFRSDIARGILPPDAKIGGLIEIHGNGGKGIDWTEGCIALSDNEMDQVFRVARVGTPVTIIGSMLDLQHVLNR
jgi:L,D-transpeptidase catalytic domain